MFTNSLSGLPKFPHFIFVRFVFAQCAFADLPFHVPYVCNGMNHIYTFHGQFDF